MSVTNTLGDISEQQARLLATQLEEAYRNGDNSAAKEHLKAGNPIYYIEENTPKDILIKEPSRQKARSDPNIWS